MNQHKPKILVFYDYFDPAYKAGGPIRSIVNLVRYMEDEIDFYIIAGNTDHDGTVLEVESDVWLSYGKSSKVAYLRPASRNLTFVQSLIEDIPINLIYVNGIYSPFTTILPLRLAKKWKKKVAIAPRGMLQKTSRSIKPIKKWFYLFALRKLLIPGSVQWQVTTQQEFDDLVDWWPVLKRRTKLIGNVPHFSPLLNRNTEKKEVIKFGTVALISPMKNIHLVLDAMNEIKVPVKYHLYGPIKDREYWEQCQKLINKLPVHIQFTHHGAIPPPDTEKVIRDFHFYIQPSRSENFGHSIFEAFNQGVPVIISDQTPWRNLATKKAGWDVSLKGEELLKAIRQAIEMQENEYREWRKGARKIAENYMSESHLKNKYLDLFQDR